MNLENYKFVSSNKNKLKELTRFGIAGLTLEEGVDLREVDGTAFEVIVYKAAEAGANRIVEDSSLFVNDSDIGTNIKFHMKELENHIGKEAEFLVLIGVNDGESVKVYEGSLKGHITPSQPTNGEEVFGFDNNFTPVGSELNLHQLNQQGLKDQYSPRFLAVKAMLAQEAIYGTQLYALEPWSGGYQS